MKRIALLLRCRVLRRVFRHISLCHRLSGQLSASSDPWTLCPTGSILAAVLINLGLLVVFALQHSVMARQGFKRVWTKIVPKPVERSTYVLFSSLALILLFWLWQPIGGFDLERGKCHRSGCDLWRSMPLVGACCCWRPSFIDHFDPVRPAPGVSVPAGAGVRGAQVPQAAACTKLVRHPIYVAWIIIAWATPVMTVAHLLFAAVSHRLHPGRDSVGRAGPGGLPRRRLPALSGRGAGAGALHQGSLYPGCREHGVKPISRRLPAPAGSQLTQSIRNTHHDCDQHDPGAPPGPVAAPHRPRGLLVFPRQGPAVADGAAGVLLLHLNAAMGQDCRAAHPFSATHRPPGRAPTKSAAAP